MNKFYLTVCFCLSFLLFLSCERPDLTDDVEMAYEIAASSCKTIDGYTWSPKASSSMTWHEAVSYCDNLTECGYTDWRLPNINELRTLIKNCPGSQAGGLCDVTDSCPSSCGWDDACSGCSSDSSGKYSKLGDSSLLWSSSVLSDNSDLAWFVYFDYGRVGSDSKHLDYYVRCVR